jgi:hypothetical protein
MQDLLTTAVPGSHVPQSAAQLHSLRVLEPLILRLLRQYTAEGGIPVQQVQRYFLGLASP